MPRSTTCRQRTRRPVHWNRALALALLMGVAAPALGNGLSWRTDHPGTRQFLVQPGQRAIVQGYARKGLEAWIYPFQILRDYRVSILGPAGLRTPLASLPLRTEVHPDGVDRIYTGKGFGVAEHWFVPHDRAGAVIDYRLHGTHAVTLQVRFQPVLDLMWPGAIGGQSSAWNDALQAFVLSEPTGRYSAYVGSPQVQGHSEPGTTPLAFTLHLTPAHPSADVAMTLDLASHYDGKATYHTLLHDWHDMQRHDRHALQRHLARLTVLDTPDEAADRAFRWAEIALLQARVCNPELGCGLVAGYGPTRGARRPQYDWFFGGDGLVAVRGLNAIGDMPRVAGEFVFLRRYQNAKTGMMWHELSQSAGLIDWSKYPYEYHHVDTSMDYLAVAATVWRTTADRRWLAANWPSLQAAYRYIEALRDAKTGIPVIPQGESGQNEQLKLHDELSLSLSMLAAEKGYAVLAGAMGDTSAAHAARARARTLQATIGRRYWNDRDGFVVQGFLRDGKPTPQQRPPVAALDSAAFTPAQQETLIDRLLRPDFLTAWGVRSLPTSDAAYKPTSYASGSVWPLANAGFATALWTHHRDAAALRIWKALITATAMDTPGHIAEVFSGRAFRALDVAVPAQTWSSAGFITATVHGLLGYHPDAAAGTLRVAPHLPAGWHHMAARRLPFGGDPVDLDVSRKAGVTTVRLTLQHPRKGTRWTVTLPARCSTAALHARADGQPVTVDTTTSAGHAEATAHGIFEASRHLTVALSCHNVRQGAKVPTLPTTSRVRPMGTSEGRPRRGERSESSSDSGPAATHRKAKDTGSRPAPG